MAREVFVCLKCEQQGATQDGFCKDCGPTQVMCLDDFARRDEIKKENAKREESSRVLFPRIK